MLVEVTTPHVQQWVFHDKVVLVTGASSEIGAAIAIKFSEHGGKVVIVGRNASKLKNVSAKCEEIECKPLTVNADVTKEEDVTKIVRTTIDEYKTIDVLINNAGVVANVAICDANALEVFDRVMNTNLRSAALLTHLAVPHLINTRGNIVTISSIAAMHVLTEGNSAYCTSKAGLDHFSRAVALELAPKGVRVNTVNPGPVKTEIFDNAGVAQSGQERREKFWEKMRTGTALGRISEPNEIADLVVFLASDRAVAITGSSFVCDNGVLLLNEFEL